MGRGKGFLGVTEAAAGGDPAWKRTKHNIPSLAPPGWTKEGFIEEAIMELNPEGLVRVCDAHMWVCDGPQEAFHILRVKPRIWGDLLLGWDTQAKWQDS